MRRFIIILLSAIAFPLVSQVFAHATGPPYVLVNGQYAQTNPIINATLTTSPTLVFPIGLDVASSSGYLVGTPIVFGIDETNAPFVSNIPSGIAGIPQQTAGNIVYQWNFGDHTSPVTGKPVTHTYAKTGTYMVTLAISNGEGGQFTNVDTIQLSVIPTATYQFPSAEIEVNGTNVDHLNLRSVTVDPYRTTAFRAVNQKGSITSYHWDFGDEKGAGGQSVTHKYSTSDFYGTYPVLRLTDVNGISVDEFFNVNAPPTINPFIIVRDVIEEFIANITHTNT